MLGTIPNAFIHLRLGSFFSPPHDAFMAVLERESLITLFVAMGWAWCCLGIKFADMARGYHDPTVTLAQAVSGDYIEAAVCIIPSPTSGQQLTLRSQA
jgi:hypothetical protein